MKAKNCKTKQILWTCILLLVATILLALYAWRDSIASSIYSYEQKRIETSLSNRISITDETIDTIISDSLFVKSPSLSMALNERLQSLVKNDIALAIYKNGKIIAWSNSSPGPDEFNPFANYDSEPVALTGGVYLCNTKDTLGLHFISAIKVSTGFIIKNKYLQAKTVPESIAFNNISLAKPTEFQIKSKGKTVYSLLPNKGSEKKLGWLVIFSLLAISISANNLLRAFDWLKFWWLKLLAAPVIFFLIVNATIINYPELVKGLPPWLFNHELTDIGKLLQIAFITVFSIPVFVSGLEAKRLARWNDSNKGIVFPSLLLLLAAFTAGLSQLLLSNLLALMGPIGEGSAIEWAPSLIGLLTIVSLGWVMLLLVKVALRLVIQAKTTTIVLGGIALLSALLISLLPYNTPFDRMIGVTGALLLPLLIALGSKSNATTKLIPTYLSIVISVVLSLQLINDNHINTQKTLENIAKELAVDQDLNLESKIKRRISAIENDSTITVLLKKVPQSLSEINRYVRNTYFKDFSAQYDLQITACPRGSKLIVNDTPKKVDCQNFFVEMATLIGRPIVAEQFYFLNNNNGRISYLFLGRYNDGKGGRNFLAIEIDSKATLNLPGYPSLLSNKAKDSSTDLPTNVSYAKYRDSKLEMKVGKYPYPLKRPEYFKRNSNIDNGNYNHVIQRNDNQQIVVVSEEKSSLLFLLSPLVYIFLGAYILVRIVFRRRSKSQRNIFTLQKRIQRLSVSLMVISMLAVGTISLGYGLSRQETTIEQGITEKMRSAVTLTEPTAQQIEAVWSPGMIDSSMIATSNILYADLNIYSPTGDLMGTSRHEVFSNKLQGYWINPTAFTAIMEEKRDFVLVTEQIGLLKFTSAYAPLLNKSGDIIAILNLPYFIRENEIRQETLNLVGRIANTYLLLAIMAGLLGYFAAFNISKPLHVLKLAMRKTSIAGQPELLEYRDNDEIGYLVKEYNRMAAELSNSAQLLAQSEKEKVWREMARQIAHEIKNPLTPIKLSLQQLVRIKKDGAPDWDQRFYDFSKMLLEQVDILAKTASQFSAIATDVGNNSEVLNMAEFIENTISLFGGQPLQFENNTENTTIKPLVFADKELMQKALTNLVANALQASSEVKIQKVTISLIIVDNLVQMSITDNGYGIPTNLQPHIFEPYFTTKSSGTGLGLVLVRKTIEESGGKIWFESKMNAGTTFFIQIPLLPPHTDKL
ncbi:sensor histidine kinase [Williamwhitmania taraxaci]|uniref:histidine kinase n=1 Tax=Williamwhitmania taraxaci TaxID=1640674 RepID=A0A1G6ISN7_9BACT|nr:HAMP domain-containing sensor histidine kinase [Williamwhitmania taraxaci]SDC09441.1 HAMP domain-containing protein [Williamwhitmania taraxaci]